jgi:hypothetical protein
MIGVEWFLFLFWDLEAVSGFAFVPDFLAESALLQHTDVFETDFKPFLTIFGTRMRAI